MTTTMALDYVLCMIFEQLFKYLFADSVAKDIAVRTEKQNRRETERLLASEAAQSDKC